MTKRLLIIDDNALFIDLLEVLLESADEEAPEFQIDRGDGLAAFKRLAVPGHYDLVLCDLRLKDAREEELFAHMSVMAGNLPVILMTGWLEPRLAARAEAVGVLACIDKDEVSEIGFKDRLLGMLA